MKPKSRPTARAGTLLVAALVLYFFANQTQVGWLYLMAAVMAGCVAAARIVNRHALDSISATRSVCLRTTAPYPGVKGATARLPDAFHESDEIEVALRLVAQRDRAQITLTDERTLAEIDRAQLQTLYLPHLPRHGEVGYAYTVRIRRRGVHRFAPMRAESRAPFGIFTRSGTIAADASLVVYPEVRPLRRMEMLDRRLSPQQPRPRAGHGGEVIGARPYRPGDSPRHVHWRSSARIGQLITKEFADESQPTLVLALDCFAHPYTERQTFEVGVKIATSIGEYALRSGYRLMLLADGLEKTPASLTKQPMTWHLLLETLARVQATGTRPIADLLRSNGEAQIVIVLPFPDQSIARSLTTLNASGVTVITMIVGGIEGEPLAAKLRAVGIDVRHIHPGEDWLPILERSPAPSIAQMTQPVTGARA